MKQTGINCLMTSTDQIYSQKRLVESRSIVPLPLPVGILQPRPVKVGILSKIRQLLLHEGLQKEACENFNVSYFQF